MSLMASCSVPATDFFLGELLAEHEEVRISLERVVPMDEGAAPYLWFPAGADGAVETLATAPAVAETTVLDRTDDGTLVRVEWERAPADVVALLARTGGTVLDGYVADGEWQLELRFPDREGLRAFARACNEAGIDLSLGRVTESDAPGDRWPYSLTDEQYETLVAALEEGYFEVPREVTLTELGDRLGVTDVAVSQRLRRGTRQLLTTTLGSDSSRSDGEST